MNEERELLELAAKAAGIDAEWHTELGCDDGLYLKGERGPDNSKYWSPLKNDGDALRLLVTLGGTLCTATVKRTINAYCGRCGSSASEQRTLEADPYAATRRAIVRAAAAMAPGQGESR